MKSLFKFLIHKTLYSISQSMKKGYYLRQESAHSLTTIGGGHVPGSKNPALIITTRRISSNNVSGMETPNWASEERILPLQNSQCITKTTELRVTYAQYDDYARHGGWVVTWRGSATGAGN